MAEWKDYASFQWKSDGTVWSTVSTGTNQDTFEDEYTRTQLASGSTNLPETGSVYWTYDSLPGSSTDGPTTYLFMYIRNPNYNAATNDAMLLASPSGSNEPSQPPGYWSGQIFGTPFGTAAANDAGSPFNVV